MRQSLGVAARRRHLLSWLGLVVALGTLPVVTSAGAAAAADPCDPGSNPIVCENSKPGVPSSEWDISGAGDESIQGFATDMSVDAGDTIGFKVDTDATDYEILIYRTGWYGGDGARLVATVDPSARLPQTQPACLYEDATGLIDCGNWTQSASWAVPADAVSGVYIARLRRTDTGGDSHIVFVVRDDSSTSDIVFQTSDTTWQAYNAYGGNSLYSGEPWGRALKVSYNRPFTVREDTPNGRDSFFGSEYAMVRWLERNGYDVSYVSGVDTDRSGAQFLDNHATFLSVGHDEYWSGTQRANVEAARDAGVNLAFLSGNEVYWKTRWEPSIDGSNTAHRTMVTYKETRENAKVDPSPEWTGTWRDPRFSPPSDGGRPENSLTGTLFTVNCCTYAIKVPAEFGDLRFWRNTSVASLPAGGETELPWGTLGYEWDEDIENGHRPAGAFRMSETTEVVPERLTDFGTNVAQMPATHHLMMYRAPSGALVFGAGTVQWSWGLDDYHDGPESSTSTVMRQATVNVLADMGAQPDTLQSGLVAASRSTDGTGPAVSIAAPLDAAAVAHGDVLTVSGTATDTGGGVVAGVEVSTDGGATWRRADGRDQWSYEGAINRIGVQPVMARAVDDSGNLGPAATVTVGVSCPCQIFSDGDVPTVEAFQDSTALEVGVRFQADVDGWIEGIRFYKGPGNTGSHVGSLWDAAGNLLARATFTDETATGWQQVMFGSPVQITAATTYVASYHAPNGHYPGDTSWFSREPTLSPPLRALEDGDGGANGLYEISSVPRFPTSTYSSANYWVDVAFNDVKPPDVRSPQLSTSTPADDSTSVPVDTTVAVTFDEPVDPASVDMSLASGGSTVQGSFAVDPAGTTVTFTPADALAYSTTYAVTIEADDPSGNAMASSDVSFTTSLPNGAVAALWDDSVVPAQVASSDTGAVNLGVRFVASEDLKITGVRFYKGPGNTGTHVGSLWSASGALLARATFTDESTTGWQQVEFAEPVTVTAGATYVASYHAPKGRYPFNGGYFTSDYTSGPLTAPATSGGVGNGVYAYGGAPAFPSSSWGATNYWVSPVYERPPDVSAPRLLASSPVDGTSSVDVGTTISATLSESVDPGSVTVTVTGDGVTVDGVTSYNAVSSTVTFVPDQPLATGTEFTVAVSATDLAGNATAVPLSYTFTTVMADGAVNALWDDSVVPAQVASTDTNAVNLGVRFVASEDLEITGVRFYKGPGNTGTHVGSLWSESGELLAQATFTDESTTGWQQVEFAEPVTVTAGATYVASYHAPNGRYSVDSGYFATAAHTSGPLTAPVSSEASGAGNGVFRYGASPVFPVSSYGDANYWVTPVYQLPVDGSAPGLEDSSPSDGATGVAVGAALTATFDEPVNSGSVEMSVQASGSPVAGATSYDAASRTATFQPDVALSPSTGYVVSVTATDLAGNATASPLTFDFTTAGETEPGTPSISLWDADAVPTVPAAADPGAIEVGVKFNVASAGQITGVRFYKGPGNTGTHVGSLWSESGELLAQATFTDESTTGWQQVEFAEPVTVTAGATYVASYHAPNGRYSVDSGYFATAAHTSGPLTAPVSSEVGGNGVYSYSAAPTLPGSTYGAANYWVSPVFVGEPDTTPPTLVDSSPSDGATGVAVGAVVSATLDESVDGDTIELTVTAGGSPVAGSMSYDPATSTATFTPDAPLAPETAHTVSLTATDLAGNTNPSPLAFDFTTGASGVEVAALWDDSVMPSVPAANDNGGVNLGVAFTASDDVAIAGVRFYKGPGNTGRHVGSLWDEAGNLLAQATFTGETSTGWQEVLFPSAVPMTAGAVYIASYHAPNGHYSVDGGYFSQEHTAGPLTALASSESTPNGLYSYGSSPARPSSSYGAANYWVSPVYQVGD